MRTSNQLPVILTAKRLSADYLVANQPPVNSLLDVSFKLREGEILGVVGESGCGKTTLMLSLMRLLPAAGRIVDGEVTLGDLALLDLSENEMAAVRWQEIAMIFQGAMNALNPVKTVGDQIAEAIVQHRLATDPKQVKVRVAELLDLVGIRPERATQYPHQYSGGMRQRAMIAMALACNPRVVIADEPTTALDVMIQAQILELLRRLRDTLGLSILFVTHDLGVVAEICDTVLVMYGGMVAEYGAVDTIFNEPQHPYTQELLRAFPDVTRPGERLASIPGQPPRLQNPPAACRFAPRCPQRFDRCETAVPDLVEQEQGHQVRCFLYD